MSPVQWVLLAFVVGGLTYSIRTVYDAVKTVTDERVKALGFVAITEGVMVFSPDTAPELGPVALLLLVCINATAGACNVAKKSPRTQSSPKSTDVSARATPRLAIERVLRPKLKAHA